jgi:hypothetical protein
MRVPTAMARWLGVKTASNSGGCSGQVRTGKSTLKARGTYNTHTAEAEFLLFGRREVGEICVSVGEKILLVAGAIISDRE